MERLLSAIAAGTCVSAEATRRMRLALEAQQIHDRLGRHVPDAVVVANKTGNFAEVIHDAGILTSPGRTLTIAVLTEGVRPPWAAADTIAEIAALLWQECADTRP
jgi:beta-lactamase class A